MKRMLTNTAIKNAKPNDNGKPKKHSDGGGLFLLVNQVDFTSWRVNNWLKAKTPAM